MTTGAVNDYVEMTDYSINETNVNLELENGITQTTLFGASPTMHALYTSACTITNDRACIGDDYPIVSALLKAEGVPL